MHDGDDDGDNDGDDYEDDGDDGDYDDDDDYYDHDDDNNDKKKKHISMIWWTLYVFKNLDTFLIKYFLFWDCPRPSVVLYTVWDVAYI